MSQTLAGVRVLDLSRLAPGPYATRLLAELGAEIIKIEAPPGGDYARWWPPLLGDPPASAVFRELNGGKRGVALDLKHPDAKAAFEQLLAKCDVLIDGFRPGVLARLGLEPERLLQTFPRLIYCAITGYGLTGPDKDRAGHDINYMARAGVLSVSGSKDAPIPLGIQVADFGSALVAMSGILAALYERERTGRGKVVDVSLAESAMAFGPLSFAMMHGGAAPPRGEAMLDGSRPCYRIYRAKEGFLAVGALEPKFWELFLETIGLTELVDNGLDVGEAALPTIEKVQARLLEKTRDEWAEIFRMVDACVEPVLSLDEAERDPHHVARGAIGKGYIRSPVRLTNWEQRGHADGTLSDPPGLGEHTEETLRALGVDDELLQKLR